MTEAAMETLSHAARRLSARLIGRDCEFSRVVTDTRSLRPGDWFVALRGEHFDGHEFVRRAASLGAAGALVARPIDCELPQVLVPDTLTALQSYASSWRQGFDIPVIGVTGSNGKTTTKQLLASVCAALGPGLATEGNLNNHIGVPLTLCRLRAEHRTAVIEMGANHAGEIASLSRLARPGVAVVTQAGDAHLEGFGSRAGVARAKGELFEALAGQGVAVINADDAYAPLWRELAGAARMLEFGLRSEAAIRGEEVQLEAEGSRFVLLTPAGSAPVRLPLPGRHNVLNALAAAAGGIALGLSLEQIVKGLETARGAAGRVVWKALPSGARLIDDSYNANPSSLAAGLDLLASQGGERWAVLGAMGELGAAAEALSEEAGRYARGLGIERLYALGTGASAYVGGFGPGGVVAEQLDELLEMLRPGLREGVTVLVKGSRSARMERVVQALSDVTAEVH